MKHQLFVFNFDQSFQISFLPDGFFRLSRILIWILDNDRMIDLLLDPHVALRDWAVVQTKVESTATVALSVKTTPGIDNNSI